MNDMTLTDLPPDVPSRPYARRKRVELSVTEAIQLLDKPGLPWGATKELGRYVKNNPNIVHELLEQGLTEDEVVRHLQRHHQGVWDARASIGTVLHRCPEAWQAMQSFDTLGEVRKEAVNVPTWQGREEEVADEVDRYVDGLERFWWDFTPDPIDSEFVVRTQGLYIGTTDLRAEMNGEIWDLDFKTTAEQDPKKGVYTYAYTLQLTALTRATERLFYRMERGKDSKWRPVIDHAVPHTRADRCGVVHLRGDGNYTLLEVIPDDNAMEAFLALVYVGKWKKDLAGAKPVSKAMSA
jgi:hypothetical protein